MRVLLLNPPASTPAIRDYYCSKHTKSNYLFQPIDLVMQSGLLAAEHEVVALDATAERMRPEEALNEIASLRPEAVLGLWGAATDSEDADFYRRLTERLPAQLFISGEVVLADPRQWLTERPFVDGALLRFVSTGLADFLGRGEPGPDLIIRRGKSFLGGLDASPPREFSLGRPRHELFDSKNYHFSFARGRRFATVLTDFSCPFPCRFCVMSGLGHRVRPIGEVVDEIAGLAGQGVHELFITDQCFGAARRRSLDLLDALARQAPGLGFTTFTRADLLDADLIAAFKSAGGHTLIMGVESASAAVLESYKKSLDPTKVKSGFAACRRAGIRTVATFIVGLPEDTAATIYATMNLARELDPDFVSYNVAVPRAGTELRAAALAEGLYDGAADPDQAGDRAAMRTRELSRERVAALKRAAVRDFYLRPNYLWRRLRQAGDWRALAAEAREGLALLAKNLGR